MLSLSAKAQVKVSGTVTDAAGQPLSGVIIKSIDATTKKMAGYAQSGNDGHWTITAKAGSLLQFTAMGFKKQELTVKEGMKEQRVALEDNAVALKEIMVKAAPVRLSGDTIKYLLSTYSKPEDRTLADVLSRVPGFEVNKDNGQISYEGKSISNFYIEGMDLMGGKYGVSAKSLPQQDVAMVEVMKHHQPIRVFDDFTYSDDNAINIRMKKGAKEHWIATFDGGAGVKSHGGLWCFESFAMRLKPSWQTIITYKTNNTGKDILSESEALLTTGELGETLRPLIVLPAPSTSRLGQRSLFNRTHVVTFNTLLRLTDNSQMNLQVTYTNDREEASAQRTTEYFVNTGNRMIDNKKEYLEKDDHLTAKLKYENNSGGQYLKNELSGDLLWSRQWLTERGTNPHDLYGRLPEYTLKDNLMVMRRMGNRLVTLESKNIMQVRPNGLNVDALRQDVNQHYYETDTYLKGSFLLGKFIVSGRAGINAGKYAFSSNMQTLLDSLGLWTGSSHYFFSRIYANPEVEYKISDFDITFSNELSWNHYSYSVGDAYSRVLYSPELHIRWQASPRWQLGATADITNGNVDANQFYPTIVLQDYQYIHRGLADYRVARDKGVSLSARYGDALRGTHLVGRVKRTFGSTPYTTSQEYEGDYIIVSLQPQRTTYNAWNVTLFCSQGIGALKGTLNARALYNAKDAEMIQNGEQMPFKTRAFNLTAGLTTSLIPTVDVDYHLTWMRNTMKMQRLGSSSTINSWKHEAKVHIPIVKLLSLETLAEYYHNQLSANRFKDIFFADASLKLQLRRFDITLALNNLLNRKTYAYALNSDLMRSTSSLLISGRELMINIYYKL